MSPCRCEKNKYNMSKKFHLSIVSPVYRARELVDKLVTEIIQNVETITDSYEIILIEDGCPENSWMKIEENCKKYPQVRGIKLSRNFGQHNAIIAGLEATKGEWTIVMDCDLQDRPIEIPKLYEKTQEGYKIVYAQRKLRQDPLLKRLSSKLFYGIFGYLTDTKQDPSIANFGIYHKQVIQAVLSMNDHLRYFPIMVRWVGFKSTKIGVHHALRKEGRSSYSWLRLFKLAANSIIFFSDKPLRIIVRVGFLLSTFSFIVGLFYLYSYLSGTIVILGFTSIILTITFLFGLMFIILGLIGIYLGKTFEQTKQRPIYIIHEKLNIDE